MSSDVSKKIELANKMIEFKLRSEEENDWWNKIVWTKKRWVSKTR
jgi:hypothetical protein